METKIKNTIWKIEPLDLLKRQILTLESYLRIFENGKQLVKSAGSVGANYIEANEALSRKDFLLRIKICKKEAKESGYWYRLTRPDNDEILAKDEMIQESVELMKIFGSIIEKSK